LKEESPELHAAIEKAPGSTIFFHTRGKKVQQLAFSDVYQLEKQASRDADGGRGNLVLRSQGVKPIADKVFNVDEKRPRIAVAVGHDWLSLEGKLEYGMPGVKKALEVRGFDVRELLLRKNEGGGIGPHAVLTRDENKYQRLEEQVAALEK